MADDYFIDLKTITLAAYAKELEQTELLSSRRILQEDISSRFECLSQQGIHTLDDLLVATKTPEKVKALAQKTDLSEEYLTIFKREVGSNLPQPVKLEDFPGIEKEAVQKLAALGLRNTRQLFDFVKTDAYRQALSAKAGIPAAAILELTKLTDVSRIRWVGANFARLLVDSGCDTVEKVSRADYVAVYAELMRINEEKKYFKGKFGLNDMKLCVQAARVVPLAIRY